MVNVAQTGVSVQQLAPVGRVARRPAHHFQLRTRPYHIQPFFIAPVLPGETMKNLLIQSRVVADPVKNALTGWWCEYYVWYVKLRDLDGRDDFTEMILTPSYSLAAYNDAADAKTYHAGPGINWTQLCLEKCTEEFFRHEGEAWDLATLDGLPSASITGDSWLDSIRLTSDAAPTDEGDHEFPEQDPVLPDYMAGFESHYAQWQHMRALKLVEATFEDWLKTFGVKAPKPDRETHRPELVRYVRDWTYPYETVDSTGLPVAGVRWNIAERADKDRFFGEPGFLFGVTIARPKVYMAKQVGAAIGMLNDAFSFLPAIMANEPYTSLREMDNSVANGPLGSTPSGPYWVDLRDLFVHGDQFANFTLSADTTAAIVEMPTSTLSRRFPVTADIDNLFVGSTAATRLIRQDGIVTLNILGGQRDQT